jgi:hypothetical protein
MIQSDPAEAISESHAITFDGKTFHVEGYIPYDKTRQSYRSPAIATMLYDWYDGIMEDILG